MVYLLVCRLVKELADDVRPNYFQWQGSAVMALQEAAEGTYFKTLLRSYVKMFSMLGKTHEYKIETSCLLLVGACA